MKPILLGKKNTPLDLTELQQRSMACIGKLIFIGDKLTNVELKQLGFLLAVANKGLYFDNERESHGKRHTPWLFGR